MKWMNNFILITTNKDTSHETLNLKHVTLKICKQYVFQKIQKIKPDLRKNPFKCLEQRKNTHRKK